jgi:hypothetical protein
MIMLLASLFSHAGRGIALGIHITALGLSPIRGFRRGERFDS